MASPANGNPATNGKYYLVQMKSASLKLQRKLNNINGYIANLNGQKHLYGEALKIFKLIRDEVKCLIIFKFFLFEKYCSLNTGLQPINDILITNDDIKTYWESMKKVHIDRAYILFDAVEKVKKSKWFVNDGVKKLVIKEKPEESEVEFVLHQALMKFDLDSILVNARAVTEHQSMN